METLDFSMDFSTCHYNISLPGPARREAMGAAISGMALRDSDERIVDIIQQIVNRHTTE